MTTLTPTQPALAIDRPGLIIAVDFDGTIAIHEYPEAKHEVPFAFLWLERFVAAGARLILWTMRSDGGKDGPVLTKAVEFCRERGIEFWGVNRNPEQHEWTLSPKAFAHLYIDDAAIGCPLIEGTNGRAYVNWTAIGPAVLKAIQLHNERTARA